MAKIERRRKAAGPDERRAKRLPKTIELAVRAAEDKQALDITVLDLKNASGFTDYFVICSGTNSRQIRAIADGVTDALKEIGSKPAHVEGYDRSDWVLVDYFDFIVHVFSPATRAFYGLERLWGNAEQVAIPPAR
jgi:ribosome-associated protein